MSNELKFNEQGLIPAIVQDAETEQVLMMAWMNAEALQRTQETGEAWFWSRSRGELWHKGSTSGNVQRVDEIRYDCDADTLLLRVRPSGPACHTGETSCFYRVLESGGSRTESSRQQATASFSLQHLYEVIHSRRDQPVAGSYTSSLFAEGEAKIAQKVGEEALEVIVAALAQSNERLVEEAADLTYHMLVLLAAHDLTPQDVLAELKRRHR